MTALPTLNMIGWSIADYELAFDGIRQVNDATVWLCNQPRAAEDHDLVPGAAFIAALGEEWCSSVQSEIVDSLRAIRFPSANDDERRILLLLQYETQWGSASEPLANILAMVAAQSGTGATTAR